MVGARLRQRFSAIRRPATDGDLFAPSFFARLDRMRICFGRAHGRRTGETPVRGRTQESGIELESFKSYAPGDDIRYLDWNAAGRLGELLTRRFVAELEIPVHVLLDASASMNVPAADRKFDVGVRLAGALTYIALNNNESVRIAALRRVGGELSVEESRTLRHHGRYLLLKPFLTGLSASGETALVEGARRYLERHAEGGIVFLISDFLVEETAAARAFELLRAKKLDVWAVHVVGAHERDLGGARGRLRIVDAETGEVRNVALSEADRRRYRDDFAQRVERLRGLCHRNDVGHVVVSSESGVLHSLTSTLPAAGVLKTR